MSAAPDEATLQTEMDHLVLRHRHLLAEARRAPCSWLIEENALCWHVVLEDALEPDIDIEDLQEVLVIRARIGSQLHVALVPIPNRFRAAAPRCLFHTEVLEIRFAGS